MNCPRCYRPLLDAAGLARQADRVRALVAGAVSLAQGGGELEKGLRSSGRARPRPRP